MGVAECTNLSSASLACWVAPTSACAAEKLATPSGGGGSGSSPSAGACKGGATWSSSTRREFAVSCAAVCSAAVANVCVSCTVASWAAISWWASASWCKAWSPIGSITAECNCGWANSDNVPLHNSGCRTRYGAGCRLQLLPNPLDSSRVFCLFVASLIFKNSR